MGEGLLGRYLRYAKPKLLSAADVQRIERELKLGDFAEDKA